MAAVGKKNSPSFAFDLAEAVGKELAAVGVNINFAPVLDVTESHPDYAIGDRSISSDPDVVAKIGSALVRGFQKGGVVAVCKHFPGHGLTKVDSHSTLPVIDKTLDEIENTHIQPFRRALRARCEAIMMAHLKFPKVDPQFPVTLSRIWLQDVFRGQLRFQKIVFSDDMEMNAMAEFFAPTEAAQRALAAGVDVLIYKGSDLNALSVVITHVIHALESGEWTKEAFHASTERIAALKRDSDYNFGQKTDPASVREIVGCAAHQAIAKQL
jgi:beta-N-acetylhexosaminidase